MSVSHSAEYRHFSAEVRIEVRVADQTFRVASMGPREIILHKEQYPDVAPCEAEISLFVDGEQFIWSVHLPEGMVPFSREVPIEPRGEMFPASGRLIN